MASFTWQERAGIPNSMTLKPTVCNLEALKIHFILGPVISICHLVTSEPSQVVYFKNDYPEAKVCLLYRSKERLMIKNVLCLPCDEFLKNLVPQNAIELWNCK